MCVRERERHRERQTGRDRDTERQSQRQGVVVKKLGPTVTRLIVLRSLYLN